MNNNFKFLLITLILLFFLNINYLYEKIYAYPHASVEMVCNPIHSNTTREFGASTIFKENNITVIFYEKPTDTLIKHEWVHIQQSRRPIWFSFSCKYPIQKHITEIEAYVAQDLPNNIFDFIYKEPKI